MPSHHELLHQNLLLLHELAPGKPEFRQCVKENMFVQPNRTGFIQVLHYLCTTYDAVRYSPTVPWPILDRDHERTFRQNTVSFVKDVIKKVPEARIPPFAPSFLSTPGGDRFATFMWKLSLLVLTSVVEKESDTPIIKYPTKGLHLIQALTEKNMSEVKQKIDDIYGLMIDASIYAKKLSNNILNQMSEIKSLRSELAELVSDCSLSENDKSVLLGDDTESSNAVLIKWQSELNDEVTKASAMLDLLQKQSRSITNCYESVKTLVTCQNVPVVLDATPHLKKFEGGKRNLNLADVLYEAADAVCVLMKSLSACGGLQSFSSVLPSLHNIEERIQQVANSLNEAHLGYSNLICQSLDTLKNTDKDGSDTSPLKGRLKQAYEMLQEAQNATPPLVFNVPTDLPATSRIGSQSPPVGAIVESIRLPSRLKPISENGSTPTASRTNSRLGLSSKTLITKIPITPCVTSGHGQSSNGQERVNSSVLSVDTPANFNPRQTSTACKPIHNVNKNGNYLCVPGERKKNDDVKKSKINPQNTFQGLRLPGPKQVDTCPVPKPLTLFPKALGETFSAERKDESVCERKIKDIPSSTLKIRLEDRNTEDGIARSKMLELVAETLSVGRGSDEIEWKQFLKSEPLLQTPVKTTISPKVEKTNIPVDIPKIITSESSFTESAFDSPRMSLGICSPASADGSFYSTDLPDHLSTVPEFDLNFEDEISPSGRVSLCPSSENCELNEAVGGAAGAQEAVPDKASPATRGNQNRRSLQAIIHRYRTLVASSKPVPQPSPPSSPSLDFSSEDLTIGADTIKVEGLDDMF